LIVTTTNKCVLFSSQNLSGHESHLQTRHEDEVNLTSPHLKHPAVRYLVYTTCTGNSMARRELGTSRKQFSPTSATFHLSLYSLWQAVNM